eukprot:TRINITY_DN5137_c0_g1_i1.p1 TRINITY_DN5137_c0_g1~~TRINITY_DN5137_c0_g1_i1.p1  ORF type:complete len:191 (-),score=35.77 TRINITY_DN5137_c0_g1_i1:21-593(-)
MVSISILPREILFLIFSFVRFSGSDWLNIKLVNKNWCRVGNEAFDPSQVDALVRLLRSDAAESAIIYFEEENYAFEIAIRRNRLQILNRMLEDSRVDPSIKDNYAIRLACSEGSLDIADRLLQDDRVHPSVRGNQALLLAIEGDYVDVVRRLLEDKRIDPCVNNNSAIQKANNRKCWEIVEILKQRGAHL